MSRTDRGRRIAGGPAPEQIRYFWTVRERQAARVECRTAVKEHRATGSVTTEPTVRQHRHGAQWCFS